MKATFQIPAELYRQRKAQNARDGRTLTDVATQPIEQGLRSTQPTTHQLEQERAVKSKANGPQARRHRCTVTKLSRRTARTASTAHAGHVTTARHWLRQDGRVRSAGAALVLWQAAAGSPGLLNARSLRGPGARHRRGRISRLLQFNARREAPQGLARWQCADSTVDPGLQGSAALPMHLPAPPQGLRALSNNTAA